MISRFYHAGLLGCSHIGGWKTMDNKESTYQSFLLRLWLADGDGKPAWRASLERPLTGERKGFANLAELSLYLEQLTHIASKKGQNGYENQ